MERLSSITPCSLTLSLPVVSRVVFLLNADLNCLLSPLLIIQLEWYLAPQYSRHTIVGGRGWISESYEIRITTYYSSPRKIHPLIPHHLWLKKWINKTTAGSVWMSHLEGIYPDNAPTMIQRTRRRHARSLYDQSICPPTFPRWRRAFVIIIPGWLPSP
jgi:hypothetical protein